MRAKGWSDERGLALLTAIVLMGALAAIAAAHVLNVQSSLRLRGVTGQRNVAYYAAEGGLNIGITRFVNIFRDSRVPSSGDFAQSVAFDGEHVAVSLSDAESCSPCPPTRIPLGEVFAGLNTIPYRYTIHSTAARLAGDTEAHVAGEFDIHNIPIFQFLAFIDGDLFIMPLPDMTLHGRIHTNGDLYVQPDAELRIEDLPPQLASVQVTAVGDIYRGGRKYDADWRCWGGAYIDKLEDLAAPPGDLDPLEMACAGESAVADDELARWLGSVKSEVENIVTPDVDVFDRGDGLYWERADLRIVLNLDVAAPPYDFGALCPGAPASPNGLFPIEVQTAGGALDADRTNHLRRFMCERRGALFYNDVPVDAPGRNDAARAADPANYAPNFAPLGETVYRRAGEDTSGDGVVDSWDRNDDICPRQTALGQPAPPWLPPSCPAWPNTALPLPDTSWYQDMDYRRGGFFNHREQQWMYLLNLNLRALVEWNRLQGDVLFAHDDVSDGGLVLFLSVQGPASSAALNNYGVRVFDSADLDPLDQTFPPRVADPTGVSVVSDQAILVEGNFNKKDKVPAALMGDAINILSQGWEVPVAGFANDLKSVFDLDTGRRDVPDSDFPGGASGRAAYDGASSLAVNAALLFGLGPSTKDPTWYNGGLENFPRFLESWDRRTLNYRGSFVSLGAPRHKRNDWACGSGDECNVYDPPHRAYDYDLDFDRVENLPPLTPKVVFLQQRMFTRFYE